MDFIHMDTLKHDDEFIDKTIKKLLDIRWKIYTHNSTFDDNKYSTDSINFKQEKKEITQHIYNASLSCYPMCNPTMCYYLKMFFEKELSIHMSNDISKFKITKFMIQSQRECEPLESSDQLCGFTHVLFMELLQKHRVTNEFKTVFIKMKTTCSGNGYSNLQSQNKYICNDFPYNDTTYDMKGAFDIVYNNALYHNDGLNIFKYDKCNEYGYSIYEEIMEIVNGNNIDSIMRLTEMQNS
jgi:hypothetical protein